MKKYELIPSDIDGLYRIKALRSFGDVKAGDIGGYVAGTHNLSDEGNSWIYEYAKVYQNAEVFGNAKVYGLAKVFGNAKVYQNAEVFGFAEVFGNAKVYQNAEVGFDEIVCGDSRVWSDSPISNDSNRMADHVEETIVEDDMVNHPPHYNWHPKGVECIDVVEWMKSPNLANVIKYVWRADGNYKNDDIEDLKKAEWYIKREINRRS